MLADRFSLHNVEHQQLAITDRGNKFSFKNK
jgi:hypothetical protein